MTTTTEKAELRMSAGRGAIGRRRGALLALLLAAAACGGAQGEAKSPEGVSDSAEAPAPSDAASPGGEFAIDDAPTSGESGVPRPKMNERAAEAYGAGLAAFQSGDLAGARAKFVEATSADGKAYQAFYSLGVVRERLGDTPGALSSYRQATAVVSDYEPAIVAYAVLLARSGRADEALQYLNQRAAAMPRSAAVSGGLAEVKSIQGDSGAAQRYAQEALKKNPDYRPAMVTIARDHYHARRFDLALYTLKGILDGYGSENPPRDKNSAEARLIRGLIYKEQGQRGPALEELRKALELRPDLVEARVQVASYLLESGNAVEAAPLLEGALRYQSENPVARLHLGDAYRLLGKPGESKRELEWVVAKAPDLYQVHYDLGLLYLFSETVPGSSAEQAVDRAIAELEQYKKLRPRQLGTSDDTDELITRAKTKKSLLQAKAEEERAAAEAAKAPQPAEEAPAEAPPPAKSEELPPLKGNTQ